MRASFGGSPFRWPIAAATLYIEQARETARKEEQNNEQANAEEQHLKVGGGLQEFRQDNIDERAEEWSPEAAGSPESDNDDHHHRGHKVEALGRSEVIMVDVKVSGDGSHHRRQNKHLNLVAMDIDAHRGRGKLA